jgi:hypothetical protein
MEEDLPLVDDSWTKLTAGISIQAFEIRLKRPYSPEEIVGGEQVEGPTWIIASCYPEKAQDGTVRKSSLGHFLMQRYDNIPPTNTFIQLHQDFSANNT